MRKSTVIQIGRDQYKISLDLEEVNRLLPWERELMKLRNSREFHPEEFDGYAEILVIALSQHHPGITGEFLENTYTWPELDRAVAEVLQFKLKSLPEIFEHGPIVGNN